MTRLRRYVSSARKLKSKNFKHKQRQGHRRFANYGRQAFNIIIFKKRRKLRVA